jgi:isoleucyl-tRNA synthetase
MTDQNNQKKSFKDTLNLPHTDFPIRANFKEEDPEVIKKWEKENLFKHSFTHNEGQEKFILHDGPPYANGHTHIGHAYNKILKDIVCKSQRMLGKHVPVTPGWDCHGLPIEFAVKKENPQLTGAELKKACREYAQKWITIQKQEFKQLGVLMNWDNPYLTMNFSYEADVLRAFGELVENGYIERKNKTVPWCPSCQTVLASAEIEYQDRKDPSIYVLFSLTHDAQQKLFSQLHNNKKINLLVWTTTPWTLPLNKAVLLKPNTEYAVLELPERYVIVGATLVDKIVALLSCEKNVVATFNSNTFVENAVQVRHPLIDNYDVPVLTDDSVLTDDGTACVHSAPGAGPIDYEVGVKNNLEIYSPVSSAGKYTAEIRPQELKDMPVEQGQGWVITKLLERNTLLFKTSIKHSYPHCWRCRGGLIFRATKQWFCDLSKNNLKEHAVKAIENITMLPAASYNRFEATIEGRLEWCLSRQREWGVPITALICTSCDYTYINKEFIDNVANYIEKQGIEYWDGVDINTLLPESMSCPQCANVGFKKETDILDVWFDSGVSHFAVLKKNKELAYPADMYLEGKDQHRGWFQSSLLTSMILERTPCTRTIVTHGFTVDEHGRKMSKSVGNVVSPQQMIEKLGTDGLRLWAASIDNAGDAVVSEILLKNVQEVFRKIRNTCRFLLSNINDFDIATDAVVVEKMKTIDRYALQELFEIQQNILQAYQEYDFTRVSHILGAYCAVNLSAFYLDIIKDRLYVEKKNGLERRSAQTVCFTILDTITKLMAPILSFTAEQLSDCYQINKKKSIHLQEFCKLISVWQQIEQRNFSSNTLVRDMNQIRPTHSLEIVALLQKNEEMWELIKDVRSALLKVIEIQREKQLIKHSLEAKIILYFDPTSHVATEMRSFFNALQKNSETIEEFFKEFLIVSQVHVVENNVENNNLTKTNLDGLMARVDHADGTKCPRCWQWSITDNSDLLCKRCESIVQQVLRKKR